MAFADLFNGQKTFTRIPVPLDSNRMRSLPTDMSALDKHLRTTTSSVTSTGTDYAEAYVKADEEKILEDERALYATNDKTGNNFDTVSESTIPPDHHELKNEELTKIYKTYSFAYRPKDNLKISSMESEIVNLIEASSVVIIQGRTGCGKTTQVPQYILNYAFKKSVYCNIIVTQPRRIAAISIAKRVCQERDWPIGTFVGYQVGMVNNTSTDTRLTYCTTGVLLQKLISAKNMLDYTHVIIDEVHERDQQMDFLLLVVRKLLRTNSRSVRVVLMSATFNIDKFKSYFKNPVVAGHFTPAAHIDIEKSNFFHVYEFYLCHMQIFGKIPRVSESDPRVTREMMDFCACIVKVFDQLDMDSGDRYAVLIFMPGIFEIEEMHEILSSEANESLKYDIVVLHSSITNEEQQRVFDNPPEGHRRIILATNIAESSITVPGVKYVIDFCLTKHLVTDPKTNFRSLEIAWASKANCVQRAGRAGRLMDGRVYRLVPERFYNEVLPDYSPPEMLRAPLDIAVLNAKRLEMGEPKAILALLLDPPDIGNLERTILLLKEAGALVNKDDEEPTPLDGQLTDLGRAMAALPLDIRITKLILLGHVFSVLREATIMGASMAVKNMFSAPFQQKLVAYTAKLSWSADSSSDCIAFLNVYQRWMFEKSSNRIRDNAGEKRWAHSRYLQIRVLREVDALIREITQRLRNLGIVETVGPERVIWTNDQMPLVLKIVIAGGFYPNYFTRSLHFDEENRNKILGGHDPTKTVYLHGWENTQPGELYARRIQQYFQDCVTSKVAKIIVSFDNTSKVYVQFRKNESCDRNDPGSYEEDDEVSDAVYKAIKLRTIGNPIEIPVMNVEASERRANQLGLHRRRTQVLLPKDGYIDEIPRPNLELRPNLPRLDVSRIPLIIRQVISPGHFWVQLKNKENAEKFSRVRSILSSSEFAKPKELEETPRIGALVLAPRKRNGQIVYFRAVVQRVSVTSKAEAIVKVLYADYGYVDHVRACDLRRLDDNHEIAKIPALAFEGILAQIRPSSLNNRPGQWSKTATEKFHELLDGEISLFGEIYSVINGVVRLNLLRVDGKDTLNINEELVKLGFAEIKTESYLSRCNHELRQNYRNLPVGQREHYEELQYDQSYVTDSYPEPPHHNECDKTINLRGPFSPLEVHLRSLATAGIGKRVYVDNSSVNSIVLDTKPDDPHDRLLIAGSVHLSPAGHTLSLRNTTLMPNIPGLTSLLCLTFAPRMELRRNIMKSRYIGALCGLGYDAKTRAALFREHDLAVYFDVDITIDDLEEINRLRHWMNLGIYANIDDNVTENSENIAICQKHVQTVLLGILKKKRNPTKREMIDNIDRWCRYDERLLILPGRTAMFKQNIFRLHDALELDVKDDEQEEMNAHIQELRTLMTRDYRTCYNESVVCKLCGITTYGVFELRIHINTKEHKLKEERYSLSN